MKILILLILIISKCSLNANGWGRLRYAMALVVMLEARVPTHVRDAKPKHAPEKLILEHQDLALIVISVRKYFVATKRCEA